MKSTGTQVYKLQSMVQRCFLLMEKGRFCTFREFVDILVLRNFNLHLYRFAGLFARTYINLTSSTNSILTLERLCTVFYYRLNFSSLVHFSITPFAPT